MDCLLHVSSLAAAQIHSPQTAQPRLFGRNHSDLDLHESLLSLNKRLSSDLNWALKQIRKHKTETAASQKVDAVKEASTAEAKPAKKKNRGIKEVIAMRLTIHSNLWLADLPCCCARLSTVLLPRRLTQVASALSCVVLCCLAVAQKRYRYYRFETKTVEITQPPKIIYRDAPYMAMLL